MSEGQASFRDELQVVILCVSSKWFDGRINLSSHWSHSTSGLHQSHIRFDNFLFELAAVSPVLLEPWNTCESLPLRAFLRPPRFVGKIYGGEEDKTKSLSVNPFRSRGFPWSGQKGATWGDLQRKGREPITYLTLHPYAGELEPITYPPNTAQTYYDPSQQWILHQQQLLALRWTISAHTTAMNCLCIVGGCCACSLLQSFCFYVRAAYYYQHPCAVNNITSTTVLGGSLLALFCQAPTPQQCTQRIILHMLRLLESKLSSHYIECVVVGGVESRH